MVCIVFSESEFYCILVSPVIVCKVQGSVNNSMLMDSDRCLLNKEIFTRSKLIIM